LISIDPDGCTGHLRISHCPGTGNEKSERRDVMGDKGKKDKEKGQKQKTNRQDLKAKNKLAKQPKRKP